MDNISLIIFLVPACILIKAYFIYFSLIKKRNKVIEAYRSIDIQLKKRYDLIPNILNIAKTFMEHEKSLFEDVTKLRTQVMNLATNDRTIKQKLDLDSKIKGLMGQIMVSVENYPELKSDKTMNAAMITYNEVEGYIAAARRFYNSTVYDLNNAVDIFPSSVFARFMGIRRKEFFQADETEKKAINSASYLN